jgi:hypothetical protein
VRKEAELLEPDLLAPISEPREFLLRRVMDGLPFLMVSIVNNRIFRLRCQVPRPVAYDSIVCIDIGRVR